MKRLWIFFYNKMKKYGIGVFLVLSIIFSFNGCQRNNTSETHMLSANNTGTIAAETENSENSRSLNHHDLNGLGDVPEKVEFDIFDDDIPIIRIEADVTIPDVDGMDVVALECVDFEEEDLASICKVCFPEGAELFPKDLMDKVIDKTKASQLNDPGTGNKEIDDFNIRNSEIALSLFNEITLSDNPFRFYEATDYEGNKLKKFIAIGSWEGYQGYLSASNNHVILKLNYDQWIADGGAMLENFYHRFENYKRYTEVSIKDYAYLEQNSEAYFQQCKDVLDDLELEDYKLQYCDKYDQEKDRLFLAEYAKEYEGIKIRDWGSNLENNEMNRFLIYIQNDIITYLNMGRHIDFKDVLSENVKLLPFEQILDRVKAPGFLDDGYTLKNPLSIGMLDINHIRLEYAIAENSASDEAALVPVWSFYEEYKTAHSNGIRNKEYVCKFSVNAIDGSLLYNSIDTMKLLDEAEKR